MLKLWNNIEKKIKFRTNGAHIIVRYSNSLLNRDTQRIEEETCEQYRTDLEQSGTISKISNF